MIDYIPRSRDYYSAQGYAPYQWAHFEDVPFCALNKPLKDTRLVLITTAAPLHPDAGDQGPNAAYNAAAKFFQVYRQSLSPKPDLRISHIGYDRKHCEARDPATWLPIDTLAQAAETGIIGDLAPQLIGMPTNRSQRTTMERDAPLVLDACRALDAEVALLVPT